MESVIVTNDGGQATISAEVAPTMVRLRRLRKETEADGEGFEPVSVTRHPSNKLSQSRNQGEAESEAVDANSDLKTVVDAWPTLPTAIKSGILAMIGAAK